MCVAAGGQDGRRSRLRRSSRRPVDPSGLQHVGESAPSAPLERWRLHADVATRGAGEGDAIDRSGRADAAVLSGITDRSLGRSRSGSGTSRARSCSWRSARRRRRRRRCGGCPRRRAGRRCRWRWSAPEVVPLGRTTSNSRVAGAGGLDHAHLPALARGGAGGREAVHLDLLVDRPGLAGRVEGQRRAGRGVVEALQSQAPGPGRLAGPPPSRTISVCCAGGQGAGLIVGEGRAADGRPVGAAGCR